MRRSNCEIVLRALVAGLEVTLGDYRYVLGEDDKGNQCLAIVAERHSLDSCIREPILLSAQMSFDRFLKTAQLLTEEERFRIAAALTLLSDRLRKAALSPATAGTPERCPP